MVSSSLHTLIIVLWSIADVLLCAIGIKPHAAETNANCWLVPLSSSHYCMAFPSRYVPYISYFLQLVSYTVCLHFHYIIGTYLTSEGTILSANAAVLNIEKMV